MVAPSCEEGGRGGGSGVGSGAGGAVYRGITVHKVVRLYDALSL